MDIKQIQINDTTYNIKDEVAREGVGHINEILPDKANIDGAYDSMAVGMAKHLEGSTSVPAEYTFRKVDDGVSSGLAMLKQIKGKSLVRNQLASFTSETKTQSDITYSLQANGKVKVSGTASAAVTSLAVQDNPLIGIASHKYFLKTPKTADDNFYIHWLGLGIYPSGGTGIYTCTTPGSYGDIYIRCAAGAVIDYEDYIMAIDLTLMFGEGNEPATVVEFEKLYNKFPYDYNAGEIINNKTTALESTGLNQWDEQWEVGGYNVNTGVKITGNWLINKNFIPLLPNTSYYCSIPRPSGATYDFRAFFYDAEKKFIKHTACLNDFTPPANARYLNFTAHLNYGTTYNHDICINISNPTKNGTYEPYEKVILNLNLPTVTGKREGDTESSVICPDGLKSAGNAYDYGIVENGYLTKIVKVVGTVDLGGLNWAYTSGNPYNWMISDALSNVTADNSLVAQLLVELPWRHYKFNDLYNSAAQENGIAINSAGKVIIRDSAYTNATTFKTAMSGVMLNYELAAPEVWTLDTPIYVGYQVRAGGTEKRLPEDTASVVNAPFAADVVYPVDVVGYIANAPHEFISAASFSNFLAQLGTQMGGTWTMTWDATTQKYNFTFVSNS